LHGLKCPDQFGTGSNHICSNKHSQIVIENSRNSSVSRQN
jgi:hypothetical protein